MSAEKSQRELSIEQGKARVGKRKGSVRISLLLDYQEISEEQRQRALGDIEKERAL